MLYGQTQTEVFMEEKPPDNTLEDWCDNQNFEEMQMWGTLQTALRFPYLLLYYRSSKAKTRYRQNRRYIIKLHLNFTVLFDTLSDPRNHPNSVKHITINLCSNLPFAPLPIKSLPTSHKNQYLPHMKT